MGEIIRTWFKCACYCTWYSDTSDGQECPECGSGEWEIIDEEDVSEFYLKNAPEPEGL